VGAAAGALLGSQIGGGRGRLAAVAVGTLAGFWIGGNIGRYLSQEDRAGIAETTEKALETDQTQTWSNPETGVSTTVSVRDDENSSYSNVSRKDRLKEAPPLELINRYHVANTNINVRGGPGTDYVILHTLARGQRVPVIGKVEGSDWYMIAEGGRGSGFLYAPLLPPAETPTLVENAIRDAAQSGEWPQTYVVQESQCRIITQEVVLPDDRRSAHEFKACRQSDGSWVEV
jgi:surface antigen